jgi:phospholipid/cholesterol/gamma-HCH transport system substrate-binding protein
MQISNETKVGALTVIAITLMFLGYNFLKGKSVTRKSNTIYAKFSDVGSLEISNPVKIKGFRVGIVNDVRGTDPSVSEVVVAINLQEKVNIPSNSTAVIINSLTGVSSINIIPGDGQTYIKSGDTLRSTTNPDMLSKVMSSIDPVMSSVKLALDTLQQILNSVNRTFDVNAQKNLQDVVENLKNASSSLDHLLDQDNGALASTLSNTARFTENLNKNNENINALIENLRKTSDQLAQADLQKTISSLHQTLEEIQTVLQKTKGKDGTVGLLLNDTALYHNLQQTSRSLTILLDDMKMHPKRYVHFSLFGKKEKSKPLSAPLSEQE